MTINQISIFLENKFGRLNEILSFLSKENIRVITATVADTSDYGILRLITSNQIKALQLLKELTQVFCILRSICSVRTFIKIIFIPVRLRQLSEIVHKAHKGLPPGINRNSQVS